jgi:amidase
MPALKDHTPASDGLIAASVTGAGAALLGKTNIPEGLADWQADSSVYGRTNNPWDLARTPGGSTGGGGAALAAGLTPLEIGSDIGGSIRVPAAYCGVYGHRPSETAVPRTGGFPHAERPSAGALMGVQGPLARSADDLELLFDVVAGPDIGEDAGWRLALPPARHDRLGDFRVAIMPPLSVVEPSAAMQTRVEELAEVVGRAGAKVAEVMPAIDQDAYLHDYFALLTLMTSQGLSAEQRASYAADLRAAGDPLSSATADGMTLDAYELQLLLRRRAEAQAAWRELFAHWDVLVCPTALDAAFEHQSGPQHQRSIDVDGRSVRYTLNIVYPMWAIFTGQPATAFPAGLDERGLPVGLQAIGPYLEDRTTLRFAQLLEREWHGFERPPGY